MARYRRIPIFGATDFVCAVGAGLTFTRLHDSRTITLKALPMALTTLLGVGLSGASHAIALHLLARQPSGP